MHIFVIISVLIVIFIALYDVFSDDYSDYKALSSLITGICCVNENNAEIIIRTCASYIRKSNIKCFQKIYLINETGSDETDKICKTLSEKYPFFLLVDKNTKITELLNK
ncbi:MAG: hypothetical protein Q4F95_13325 [Oscillospiraceae bacterium]|nr:hypothetical protein [Oscillospiraceae bacterium]